MTTTGPGSFFVVIPMKERMTASSVSGAWLRATRAFSDSPIFRLVGVRAENRWTSHGKTSKPSVRGESRSGHQSLGGRHCNLGPAFGNMSKRASLPAGVGQRTKPLAR